MSDSTDEKPWSEAQWEVFMKRSDARADRFGELLETLIDHPDRHSIIEKEMGWDLDNREPLEMPDLSPEEEKEIDEQIQDSEDALQRMPAYQKSMEVGTKVQRLLKPLFKDDESEDVDEDISQALLGGYLPAAKIAGGHAMGYDDDVLCANIVNNKIALAANKSCQQALKSIRDRKLLPAKAINDVLKHLQQAGALIEQRIAELRSKVWW